MSYRRIALLAVIANVAGVLFSTMPAAASEVQIFSDVPSISDDGSIVSFVSNADDLVRDDGNGLTDVFVYDASTGNNTLVSRGIGGIPSNGPSHASAVSGDGNVVAFTSLASNLTSDDNLDNGSVDIFVYDRTSKEMEFVDMGLPDGSSQGTLLSLSADGVRA